MVIVNMIADFELPFVFSLKERRKILNSIKDKLKKFNVSVLDISGEYPKEASLAIVYAAHNEKQAGEIRKKIEDFLYRNFPEIEFYFDVEII
ncbi:conserved hypothetical protein [Lebetimonas natsushimae]|uniref:YlxP-like protein n=1 Tax=Lebetimonas natsushimae TaxID=1936991 RepID=A0A292YCW8_9BACT|nr:DUF503 domain-containing protein [Lebetimonas natsushimae]GAX87271.1 conserved hypothetical protein [Lebetimonas natsushimae]